MRNKGIIVFIIAAALILAAGCPAPSVPSEEEENNTDEPIVYCVGDDDGAGVYWQGNYITGMESIELPVPSEASGTKAYAVFASGSDVYIAGEFSYTKNSIVYECAVYWKDNGSTIEYMILEKPWESGSIASANDIFVTDGKVYVVGWKMNSEGVQRAARWTFSDTVSPAITSTLLPNSDFDAEAKAVFIYGSDVYVCGEGRTSDTSSKKGMYWKNSSKVFTDIVKSSMEDIYFDGTDVYAIGCRRDGGETMYAYAWKGEEGDWIPPKNVMTDSRAYSGYFTGSNVYIGGMYNEVLSYWKDDERFEITAAPEHSAAVAITVYGTHVYTAGTYGWDTLTTHTVAAYWKDNMQVTLSDGTANAHVYDMTAMR